MRLLTIFHSFLTTFSGFFILLIIFVSLGLGYGSFSLRQMNQDARRFVNTTMLGLFADWDNSHFLTYTSEELQEHITDDQLRKMGQVFTRLGELFNYHGARGGLFRSASSWWHVGARYKVQASFQGGQFIAVVTLIKQQGNWTIGRFDYQYVFLPMEKHSGSLRLV